MLQTTAVLIDPLTNAVKACASSSLTMGMLGDMATETAGTVTAAAILFVLSAWLAAITWKTPWVEGAVYTPLVVITPPAAPSCTVQLTCLLTEPVTVAVKV